MRGLECPPNRKFAVYFVHRRHAAACFQRTWVGAVVVDHFFSNNICLFQHCLCCFTVTRLPSKNMIGVASRSMCALFLIGNVFAQYWGTVHLCHKRIYNHRQFLILDLNSSNAISCSIAVISDNKRDFLCLKKHLPISKHHLLIASQSWHPVQTQWFQVSRR